MTAHQSASDLNRVENPEPNPQTTQKPPIPPLGPRKGVSRHAWLLAATGVAYALLVAVVTWRLFGPRGLFEPPFGFDGLAEYLNEVIGEGAHAGPAGTVSMWLMLLIPAIVAAAMRSWHWVWITPVAIVAADAGLMIAARMAGLRGAFVDLSGVIFVDLLLYALPAAVAAALGVLVGKGIARFLRYVRSNGTGAPAAQR